MTTILKSAVPTRDWERYQFVLKARSTDETRYFMTGIFADTDNIVCTDGRRIHLAPNPGLECGNYKVVSQSKDTIVLDVLDGVFPNYRRTFPVSYKRKHAIDLSMNPKKFSHIYSVSLRRLFRAIFPRAIDIGFVKDLEGYSWKAYMNDAPGTPIKFESSDGITALIAPIYEG